MFESKYHIKYNENMTLSCHVFLLYKESQKGWESEMAFDYKKEYKEFYMPKKKPGLIEVPSMNYIAVRGKGDPNAEGSEFKASIGLLYAVAFTIKMSKKGNHRIEGYFDYVVPPLEGFWWQDDGGEIDYSHKEDFQFISIIRLPDFVTKEDFDWAIEEATRKKKTDFSKVEFLTYEEGLCVQCMHIGPYDTEPETIDLMHDFMVEQGLEPDISDERFHHEIYLSDARRVAPEKLKTVIRHPVRRVNEKENYHFYGWKSANVRSMTDRYKNIKTPRDLYDALSEIWCANTCAPRMRDDWTPENKTMGQCSITAFLAQDIFGGKVYGILREGGNYHCYNVVGDCVFDLTSEQFGEEALVYEDNPEQFREVHFAKEEKRLRYEYLKTELEKWN